MAAPAKRPHDRWAGASVDVRTSVVGTGRTRSRAAWPALMSKVDPGQAALRPVWDRSQPGPEAVTFAPVSASISVVPGLRAHTVNVPLARMPSR